LIKSILIYI